MIRADPGRFEVLDVPIGPVPDEAVAMMRHEAHQTIVVPEGSNLPAMQRQAGWGLVHLEEELPFDVVGFLAKHAQAWAAAGIPILAFASYRYDHVFVPADRLDEAVLIAQSVS